MDQIRIDLTEHFPYKVLVHDRAEADDLIAVLCAWSNTNDLVEVGLFAEPKPILIVSSDKDFLQLSARYKNVSQYSPKTKAILQVPPDYINNDHVKHLVKAGDDGIPNILSADDVLITEGVRQTTVSAKRLQEFVERGIEACRDDFERKNWNRNQTLIDFNYIPADLQESILKTYIDIVPEQNKRAVYNYLMKHRCNTLFDELEDFF